MFALRRGAMFRFDVMLAGLVKITLQERIEHRRRAQPVATTWHLCCSRTNL
jgi:hypothetical protein